MAPIRRATSDRDVVLTSLLVRSQGGQTLPKRAVRGGCSSTRCSGAATCAGRRRAPEVGAAPPAPAGIFESGLLASSSCSAWRRSLYAQLPAALLPLLGAVVGAPASMPRRSLTTVVRAWRSLRSRRRADHLLPRMPDDLGPVVVELVV